MPYIYQDFETQSLLDLTVTGSLKYVLDTSTRALLWSWAIDDDPLKLWCPDLNAELVPEVWAYVKGRMAAVGACPAEVVEALKRPDTYIVGWNEPFDFKVWRQVVVPDHDWPDIRLEQTLDAMAQGAASNLPGKLDMAGRALNLGTKTVGGSAVMKRFADSSQPLPGSPADIAAKIAAGSTREKAIAGALEMWGLYCDYAIQDTDLMRNVWKCTRPLDATEWFEYWAFERINDRGMLADLEVCAGAAEYHEAEMANVVQQVQEITDGTIAGPTFTAKINGWIYDRLPDNLAEFMVKARDDEGYVTRLTGDKNIMTRLLEEIQASETPPADEVIDLIEILQFGRSSSALKFKKILDQAYESRLCGSYIFNGAGQTGRGSSRGVMVHNLPRAFLKNELDILDMIAARAPIERIREIGPVSSVLSKLIRPTFMAPEGKLLVWGDWSAIEARVNPWLADSRDAEKTVLEPFRNGEDLYLLNAEPIYGVPADVIRERYENGDPEAKAMRQASKVATLALGFLGSVGALKAMARSYNIRFSNEEAQVIVDGWRDRNRWARKFGDKLQNAAFAAMASPGSVQKAGKISYQYVPKLMGGTLVCFLPDGRPITYPTAKIVKLEKFGKMTDTITYLNGMGRKSMWNGLQVENCLAGDTKVLTRRGIVRLDTIQSGDLVWDGIDWVRHSKLLSKGRQPIIEKWGVQITPDHKVMTNDGWKEAQDCSRSDRADVRLPDDVEALGSNRRARQESYLVGALRLWERVGSAYRWLQKQSETFAEQLRLQDAGVAFGGGSDPRNVQAQSFCSLAVNGGPLHFADTSGVAQLRGPRNHGVRQVAAVVSRFLGGHGADVSRRPDNRPRTEQRRILVGELPMGDAQNPITEPATESRGRYAERADVGLRSCRDQRHRSNDLALPAGPRLGDARTVSTARPGEPLQVEVFDLVDCGPRNRFTVFDSDGVPFLVHNCTQATAASILRQTVVRLDVEEKEAEVVLHTHDEVGAEVSEASAGAFAKRLHDTMVKGWEWTEGLPLAAEISTSWYYTKAA